MDLWINELVNSVHINMSIESLFSFIDLFNFNWSLRNPLVRNLLIKKSIMGFG